MLPGPAALSPSSSPSPSPVFLQKQLRGQRAMHRQTRGGVGPIGTSGPLWTCTDGHVRTHTPPGTRHPCPSHRAHTRAHSHTGSYRHWSWHAWAFFHHFHLLLPGAHVPTAPAPPAGSFPEPRTSPVSAQPEWLLQSGCLANPDPAGILKASPRSTVGATFVSIFLL